MIPFIDPGNADDWGRSPGGLYVPPGTPLPARPPRKPIPVVGYPIDGPRPRQCKEIPVRPILEFVERNGGIGCHRFDREWPDDDGVIVNRSVVAAFPEGTPERLMLAKLANLIRRDLIDGCTCGCRGDYDITEKGEAWLREEREKDAMMTVEPDDAEPPAFIDNEATRHAATLIGRIYEYSGVGGNAHVVVDDNNVDDGSILRCLNGGLNANYHEAGPEQLAVEKRALEALLAMTEDERQSAIEIYRRDRDEKRATGSNR